MPHASHFEAQDAQWRSSWRMSARRLRCLWKSVSMRWVDYKQLSRWAKKTVFFFLKALFESISIPLDMPWWPEFQNTSQILTVWFLEVALKSRRRNLTAVCHQVFFQALNKMPDPEQDMHDPMARPGVQSLHGLPGAPFGSPFAVGQIPGHPQKPDLDLFGKGKIKTHFCGFPVVFFCLDPWLYSKGFHGTPKLLRWGSAASTAKSSSQRSRRLVPRCHRAFCCYFLGFKATWALWGFWFLGKDST